MKYDLLIRRAWQLTWRNRFLWVLGLFAASTVGTWSFGGGWNGGGPSSREVEELPTGLPAGDAESLRAVLGWVAQHPVLIAVAVGSLALLGIALAALSLVAQGGMSRATLDLALGRPIAAGQAWRAGAHFAWRFLGLWLVLVALGIAAAAVLAALFVPLGLLVVGGQHPSGAAIGLLALLGLLALVVGIPLALAVSVAAAFAQRAMVDSDVGAWTGLKLGTRLVRARIGASAVAWLVNLALSIIAGLAIGAGALVLLIPLGGVALVGYFAAGLSAAGVALLALAGLAFLLGVWLQAAIANAFFWNYWTLVYLHFTEQLTERLEPAPPDAGGHGDAPLTHSAAPAPERTLVGAGR